MDLWFSLTFGQDSQLNGEPLRLIVLMRTDSNWLAIRNWVDAEGTVQSRVSGTIRMAHERGSAYDNYSMGYTPSPVYSDANSAHNKCKLPNHKNQNCIKLAIFSFWARHTHTQMQIVRMPIRCHGTGRPTHKHNAQPCKSTLK